jgi:poly(3-hydroxybutyrate) depolymerase
VKGAGHYGIFSGRRWREKVYPQVRDFIASTTRRPIARGPQHGRASRPSAPAKRARSKKASRTTA